MEFRRIGAPLPGGDLWKSSGLVSLSPEGSLAYFPLLLKEDPARTPKYYDQVFQENLSALPIQILPVPGEDWMEVDSPEDLKVAEGLSL